jgi:LysM repeat protein
MRVRTRSACVVLAWGILLIALAAGPIGSFRPAQANIRIASSTSNTSSKPIITTQATLTSSVTTTRASTYVVQPGDTLSGIATALGIRGGWPALYAANRPAVGPDPGLINPGTVLTVPGLAAPARYTVAAGDTLSGIASAVGTAGGWPALYAANRRTIGANPNALRIGTVLAIPGQAQARSLPRAPGHVPSKSPGPRQLPTSAKSPASAPAQPSPFASASASAPSTAPARPPASSAATGRPRTARASGSAVAGLPRWREIVLAAAGLLIGIAFLTEPTLAIARRRRAARPGAAGARIVLADYDRLVVTHCGTDDTVCVLRPPGADPQAILLAARLVLAQDRYEQLAGHLGVPAHWPRE